MDENEIMEPAEQTEAEPPKKKKPSGKHLTPAQQLERIKKQQTELAARARAIRSRESTKERKARAHRLIKVGSVIEKVYGAPIDSEEMLETLETVLTHAKTANGKRLIDLIRGDGSPEPEA